MNSKLYIRFSNDIYADIDRGYSFFKGGEKMSGLCAWSINIDMIDGEMFDFSGNKVGYDYIIKIAHNLLKNTYGSYSDNSEFHLITGDYVGSGNDGVLLSNVELIQSFYL